MPIISLKTGTKSRSLLVGNPYFQPSSYESIATVTAAGGETSLSFNSIPGTYASLQLRAIVRRNDAGSTIATDTLRFNSDTGGNYINHRLQGDGSATAAASSGTGATEIVCSRGAGAAATSGIFGASIIDIHDYASTTKNKVIRSFTGFDINGAGGFIYLYSGAWFNTAAITSITIYANGNTIAAGETYALYGIK